MGPDCKRLANIPAVQIPLPPPPYALLIPDLTFALGKLFPIIDVAPGSEAGIDARPAGEIQDELINRLISRERRRARPAEPDGARPASRKGREGPDREVDNAFSRHL